LPPAAFYDGDDIRRFLEMGASGVQMGTRFVATHECDADPIFKQSYVDARKEDLMVIKSPVGLPGTRLEEPVSVGCGRRHKTSLPLPLPLHQDL
jgi:NAD(P)H-dependent flavin oxidoreductase YrpB (nitropropane dioxygenase family)